MSLKSLVNRNVNLAFKKIGDLATLVTFNKKSVTTYDFTNEGVDLTDTGSVVATGIQLKKTKQLPNEATNSTALKLLFKTADVGNISEYSNAVINNVTYKFEPTSEINEFVTVLSFVREN